jgi:predicted nucleic acid-binding protein
MLVDVVVDTNVWAHADNPIESRQADSIAFLRQLLATDTELCVDPGFSLTESQNRSRIGSEYLTHLSALPFASAALAALANSGRIAFVSTKVSDGVRRTINRVVRDPSDRVFVKVAHNSGARLLCSHDYTHLPAAVRSTLRGFHVDVLSAGEALPRL